MVQVETIEPLGPFQDIWDAWDPVDARVIKQPASHFPAVIQLQLNEAAAESINSRGKEVVDIISVSLNWLRWLGYSPAEVADLVRARADDRYVGKVEAILDKYKGIMLQGTIR